MPPVEIEEIAPQKEPGDEDLSSQELAEISLFKSLGKKPDFDDFVLLRRCRPGRLLCVQGERGNTAFYVLTHEDVLAVRQAQAKAIQQVLEAPSDKRANLHRLFGQKTPEELGNLKAKFDAEIQALGASPPPSGDPLTAMIFTQDDAGRPADGILKRILAQFKVNGRLNLAKPPRLSPTTGPAISMARPVRQRSRREIYSARWPA